MGGLRSGILPALFAAIVLAGCGEDLHTAREKLRAEESPLVRAAAAERLGEIGGDEAIRALTLHGLRDTSPIVRAASARALAGKDHPQVVDLLGELLLDPEPDVQEAAAQALARSRGEKARRYLELAYARTGSAGRAVIGEALVVSGASPRRTVEEMAARRLQRHLQAVEVGSQAERVGATQELGRSGRPEAVTALISQLGHPVVAIAAAAATALAETGDRRAVEPLLEALSEPYAPLRRATLAALGQLGDPAAAEALVAVALSDKSSDALGAVAALSRLEAGAPVFEGLCTVALTSTAAEVATAAVRALVRFEAPCELSERVGRGLSRGRGELLVALALAEAAGPGAVDAEDRARLAEHLDADDAEVQAAAWRAAAAVGLDDVAEQAAGIYAARVRRDRLARQRWIEGHLPTSFGWGLGGVADVHHHDDPEAHLEQLGLSGRRRYRSRYTELMERVADYRAERETMRRAAQGLGDAEGARERHLQALLADAPSARTRLLGGVPREETDRLAALARAAPTLAGLAVLQTSAELLGHGEPAVRVAAVRGLSALPDPEVTEVLLEALDETQPDEVVAALVRALADREGIAEALVAATRWAGPDGLRALIQALGGRGGAEAVDALVPLLGGPAAREAADALARMGGPQAVAPLVEHLRAVDAPGTAEVLGRLPAREGQTEWVAIARRGLHSERAEIRAASAAWLRRAGVTDPWLEALRSDYDGRVRRAAGPKE